MSGVNMGYNSGLAVYYSGTVAAAREGALNGIHSLALSVGNHEASEFDYVLDNLPYLMELSKNVPDGFFINVNAPDIPAAEAKGIKIAPVAPFGYGLLFSFFPTESGNGNYQLGAERGYTGDHPVYDMDWNHRGYMTVTPVPTAIEADEAVRDLQAVAEKISK